MSTRGSAGVFCALLASLAVAQSLPAQARPVALSLPEAERIARAHGPRIVAARERSASASAEARAADAYRWPGVEAVLGLARTDDPVGVFGMKLRQGRFSEADFAIPALNDPAAASDWTAGLRAGWSVGDPTRRAEARSADRAAGAADAMLRHSRNAATLAVRTAYLQAVAARERRDAVAAQVESVSEVLSVVEDRLAQGAATEADRLQARAALAEAEAELTLADASVVDGFAALGLELGWGADSIPVPVPGVPAVGDSAARAVSERADLEASRLSVDALRARADAATAGRLPSLDLFGALSTHASSIGGSRAANWSVGMEVRVPLFAGFALESRQRGAAAVARVAQAEHEDRVRRAAADLDRALRGAEAARSAWEARAVAREAAGEAERLLTLRYREGMVTLAELLGAQARAAEHAAEASAAEVAWRLALARVDFLRGDTAFDRETNR